MLYTKAIYMETARKRLGSKIMSGKEVTPQFLGVVRLQGALMGLTLAFRKEYGDEALAIAKGFTHQLGIKMGDEVKKKAGIVGSSLEDIEKVLHAWQDPVVLGPPPKSKIEGKKLTITRKNPTQCPALHIAQQMGLPLETVCNTVAFPMFSGVAEAVNSEAKHTNVQTSSEKCIDTIEIP